MATSSVTESFPPLEPYPQLDDYRGRSTSASSRRSPSRSPNVQANGSTGHRPHMNGNRTARRDSNSPWRPTGRGTRHGRQQSLSEAFRSIQARGRGSSLSQNAHDIADALKPPISPEVVALCLIWYATSMFSNTSSKAILNSFPKPITLTLIQFGFVSTWCIVAARLARSYPRLKIAAPVLKFGIRPPSKDLILTTLPLTLFQVGGHILTSDAMTKIPVSLVHTIKGLSPLMTVLAYRFIFDIRYAIPTYLSLIPLTVGVIMACSADFKANFLGLIYALGSAILFVTQNIVSKKLFTVADEADKDGAPLKNRKPDKLNLLCYSSGLAFLFTAPIWLWSEGFGLIGDFLADASVDLTEKPGSLDHGRLALEFVFNGTFHFCQSLVAFVLLSMVSPVTYSVASLIKRVFVIIFAIVWFKNRMTEMQGVGFLLTFVGLYLYDRTKNAGKADRQANLAVNTEALLPIINSDSASQRLPTIAASPRPMSPDHYSRLNGFARSKRDDDRGRRRDSTPGMGWLPPGTKAAESWNGKSENTLAVS